MWTTQHYISSLRISVLCLALLYLEHVFERLHLWNLRGSVNICQVRYIVSLLFVFLFSCLLTANIKRDDAKKEWNIQIIEKRLANIKIKISQILHFLNSKKKKGRGEGGENRGLAQATDKRITSFKMRYHWKGKRGKQKTSSENWIWMKAGSRVY